MRSFRLTFLAVIIASAGAIAQEEQAVQTFRQDGRRLLHEGAHRPSRLARAESDTAATGESGTAAADTTSPTEASLTSVFPSVSTTLASTSLAVVTASVTSSAPATASFANSNATANLPLALASPPSTPPQPVPQSLDYMISYALSDQCLLYLSTVLRSPTFAACLPFSLLLTTSTSYLDILQSATTTGNYATINSLLGYVASPQPSTDMCDRYFAGLLNDFGGKNACGQDVSAKKSPALLARNGIGSYTLMREAAGLVDPGTGSYCYLEAQSSSRPDDMYLWSIPAGIPVPSTSKPTCTKCSSLLLQKYASLSETSPTLNATLVNSAISTVNAACGATFVSTLATSAKISAASSRVPGQTLPWGLHIAAGILLSALALLPL